MANGYPYPIAPGAGPTANSVLGGAAKASGGLGGLLTNPTIKSGATWAALPLLISALLKRKHQSGMRNIQIANLQEQAELASPQNLYYQAALPRAQEEETMAKNALFSQLSGGVLGPTLAKGETRIGG